MKIKSLTIEPKFRGYQVDVQEIIGIDARGYYDQKTRELAFSTIDDAIDAVRELLTNSEALPLPERAPPAEASS